MGSCGALMPRWRIVYRDYWSVLRPLHTGLSHPRKDAFRKFEMKKQRGPQSVETQNTTKLRTIAHVCAFNSAPDRLMMDTSAQVADRLAPARAASVVGNGMADKPQAPSRMIYKVRWRMPGRTSTSATPATAWSEAYPSVDARHCVRPLWRHSHNAQAVAHR